MRFPVVLIFLLIASPALAHPTHIERAGGHAQFIAKLEDQEAIKNLDDIIAASDIIMVARGDLGIEVHIEELPILQRSVPTQ